LVANLQHQLTLHIRCSVCFCWCCCWCDCWCYWCSLFVVVTSVWYRGQRLKRDKTHWRHGPHWK